MGLITFRYRREAAKKANGEEILSSGKRNKGKSAKGDRAKILEDSKTKGKAKERRTEPASKPPIAPEYLQPYTTEELKGMTVAELKDLAAGREVEIPTGSHKADIVALLETPAAD